MPGAAPKGCISAVFLSETRTQCRGSTSPKPLGTRLVVNPPGETRLDVNPQVGANAGGGGLPKDASLSSVSLKFNVKLPLSDSYNGRLDTARLMLALVKLQVILALSSYREYRRVPWTFPFVLLKTVLAVVVFFVIIALSTQRRS